MPISSLHDLIKALGQLPGGTGDASPGASGGGLYIAWDDDLLEGHDSLPGELIGDLTQLLPKPGRMDLLVRRRGKTLRMDRQASGGISLQSPPNLDLGPEEVMANWPTMETLVWIPHLPAGMADAIAHHLDTADHQTLLNLPASAGLAVLQGRVRSQMMMHRQPGYLSLQQNAKKSRWVIGSGIVQPSEEFPQGDGDQPALHWLVPISGQASETAGILQASSGQETTFSPLPGQLTAPWNFDVQNFFTDPWNLHLFDQAAKVLLDLLRQVSIGDDPACVLDILPKGPAHPLSAALWRHLETMPLVPDATGTPRLARQLWTHSYDDPRIVRYWWELASPMAHRRVVHSSCLLGERPRLLRKLSEQLTADEGRIPADSPALRRWEPAQWFGALMPANPEAAMRVLGLAQLCEALNPSTWQQVREGLPIVRTAGNHFLPPREVYLPEEDGMVPDHRAPVHRDLLADLSALAILTSTLGVAGLPGPATKLVGIFGEEAADVLREAAQGRVSEEIAGSLSAQTLAEILLGVHGHAVLAELTPALREAGLEPPLRWGTQAAKAFIHRLGLPEIFALPRQSQRNSEESLMGPEELSLLHDFQQEVHQSIRDLTDNQSRGQRRALICLPAGSGRTRVVAQAAVDLILKPAGTQCQVLWVTETDELCGPVVQKFRQLWAQRGRSRTELKIIQLAEARANLLQNVGPVVVVASLQAIGEAMEKPEQEWLRRCGLIVIDEFNPGSMQLLQWIDDAPDIAASSPPLILGLSATPLGDADEETDPLSEHFEKRVFPSRPHDLYRQLLDCGVLARTTYRVIDSGIQIGHGDLASLSVAEPFDPSGFEGQIHAINSKLGDDSQRNARIIEEIAASQRQSILLFSNSPAHSQKLAATLIAKGISAASLNPKTPAAAHRWLLHRFQRHEIRVLCSDRVITDAPKVDMVFIARQVFSPALYTRMLSHGLRGPINGGNAECEIVTMQDNWLMYRDRLASHRWQKFFQSAMS